MIELTALLAPSPVKGATVFPGEAIRSSFTAALDFRAALDSMRDAQIGSSIPVPAGIDPAAVASGHDAPEAAQAGSMPILSARRQGVAGGGKALPADLPDDDPAKYLIWSPVGLIVPPPATTAALPVAGRGGGMLSSSVAAPADVRGDPGNVGAPPASLSDQAAPIPGKPEGTPERGPVATIDIPVADTARPVGPPRRAEAPAPAQPVQVAQLQVTVAQPAGQIFAAALASAVAAQAPSDTIDARDPHTPFAIAAATLDAVQTPAVPAAAEGGRAALDLKQDSGVQGMIDHIEVLRDNADAGDTRIRLVPDALGAVDVSVRRDGERVHVHFSTETQASARLLSDAQPRLAELAEARGLKLGEQTVGSGPGLGSGAGGGNPRHAPQPPFRPATPAPLARIASDTDDTRIA